VFVRLTLKVKNLRLQNNLATLCKMSHVCVLFNLTTHTILMNHIQDEQIGAHPFLVSQADRQAQDASNLRRWWRINYETLCKKFASFLGNEVMQQAAVNDGSTYLAVKAEADKHIKYCVQDDCVHHTYAAQMPTLYEKLEILCTRLQM
jgi:hypothetical protein